MNKQWGIIALLCLFILNTQVYAQQDPNMAYFMTVPSIYNPSLTAADMSLSVAGVYRMQWVGFPGNPVTQNLVVESPINKHFSGGLNVSNDQLGLLRNSLAGLSGAYAFHLKKGNLLFGVRAAISQQSLDGSKLISPDGDYSNGQVNHHDPHLPTGLNMQTQPDAAAGISWVSRSLVIGLSADHILPGTTSASNYYQFVRAYYLNIQYRKNINRRWVWQLSGLGRYDGSTPQTDIASLFTYKGSFWLGAGLRGYNTATLDAAMFYAGTRIAANLVAGYAYEAGLSGLQAYHYGSHELMIKYSVQLFQPPKPGKVIYTPRF